MSDLKPVKNFIAHNFRHFNANALRSAAQGYVQHIQRGGKMVVAMGGAMSTAELGISLAKMIRADKVHMICCTGANLEEDLFNLVANKSYLRIPNYRDLTPQEEEMLRRQGNNRVTDTCIPDKDAIQKVGIPFLEVVKKIEKVGRRMFPFEVFYEMIKEKKLRSQYQIDEEDSWVIAACEKDIPILTPGWEDSTLGNLIVAQHIKKNISDCNIIKTGLEQMEFLVDWYKKNSEESSIGFFQIGGGISGDFPICVVPLISISLREQCKLWGYYCQISESATSYGSYSGASPNEKITWGKLGVDTPKFTIESDATIVAPLVFAYVLGSDE